MGGKHFTTTCTILRNGYSVSLSALADTRVNRYLFINTCCVVDAANFINTQIVHLRQLLPIRGFNRQPRLLVTHAIILHLRVVGHYLKDLPILIADLRQHNMIIRCKWFKENDIWLDVWNWRMIWPDEWLLDRLGLIRELVTQQRTLLLTLVS